MNYSLTPVEKSSHKKSLIALLIMILCSLVLDQTTKIHAQRDLKVWSHESDVKQYRGQRIHLLTFGNEAPEANATYVSFNLNYVRNQGAAWGFLSGMSDSYRNPLFYIMTTIATTVLIMFFRSNPPGHRLIRFACALVLSGAIGNFIDRFRLNYVIDFIDVHWRIFGWQYYFPNFNFADSCISVGATLFIIDMLILEPRRAKAVKEHAQSIS